MKRFIATEDFEAHPKCPRASLLGQHSSKLLDKSWRTGTLDWYRPTDSYWKELWIFSGWCGGYPTWDTRMIPGASAICLDPPFVGIFWKYWEDPGGACLSPSYTSNKGFSELHLLLIIELPWPMTLTPTNEAISRETGGKKTLTIKAYKLTGLLGCHVKV